jgi:hypothetical protein
MKTRPSTRARDTALSEFASAVDAGSGPATLAIYSGKQPASADEPIWIDPVWGQTLLVKFTLGRPAFSAPFNGVVGANPMGQSEALASGVASWARVSDGAGNAILDVDVGEKGAAINLFTTRIQRGDRISIDPFVVRLPA